MSPEFIELIRSFLEYDENTGLFTWKVNRKGRGARIGHPAGNTRHDGYVSITVNGNREYAHRIAWGYVYGSIPHDKQIDHIDHNPSNNRIDNLRLVSAQGNRMNVFIGTRNKSGVIGVHWSVNAKKWCAQVRKNNRTTHLGYFNTIDEARIARVNASSLLGFHENHGRKSA